MIEYSSRNIKKWSRLGPSGAVGVAACELADMDDDIVFLTADLKNFSGLDRYAMNHGDRLYNLGIAEQNLIGVAAGISAENTLPFVTLYSSFIARCLDQIRVNMSYMQLPIKIIGLTAGLGAGILGPTHMSVEDIAVMRALPNITILSPADCTEIVKCIIAASVIPGPVYIRTTGPMNTPTIYHEDYDFVVGKAVRLSVGTDVCIVATGSVVCEALNAAHILEDFGISVTFINMHTLKPLDGGILREVGANHKLIATVEEHSIYGGLGSAVCEFFALNDYGIPVTTLGINDYFPPAGDYYYQLKHTGLTGDLIAKQIMVRYDEI